MLRFVYVLTEFANSHIVGRNDADQGDAANSQNHRIHGPGRVCVLRPTPLSCFFTPALVSSASILLFSQLEKPPRGYRIPKLMSRRFAEPAGMR